MSDLQKFFEEKMKDPEFRACYYEMNPSRDIAAAMMAGRARLNMNQTELAKASGVHQADISRLENLEGNPNLKTLKRIAAALGMMVKIEFIPFPSDDEVPDDDVLEDEATE